MLSTLGGKPLLQRVWEAANEISLFDSIAFAVDSKETADLIESFGGKYFMTSESCCSGTERLVELQQNRILEGDIWVNWQGDEPFIHEAMIHDLLQTCAHEESDVWSLCKKIEKAEEIHNPHIAKVVRDKNGFALYFSRSTIPFFRDPRPDNEKFYYKHVGLYAFTNQALQKLSTFDPCYFEEAEQLEQLRFLYNGLRIKMHETSHEVLGIDLPEHLVKAEQRLQNIT